METKEIVVTATVHRRERSERSRAKKFLIPTWGAGAAGLQRWRPGLILSGLRSTRPISHSRRRGLSDTPVNAACFADKNKASAAMHSGGGVNTRRVFTMTAIL